jgi:uncharacterized RDD family membrane protein YckC
VDSAPPLARRLGSLLYDGLVVVALMLLVVAIFSLVTTAAPGLPHQRPLLLALCFVTIGGYFIYCWRNGQTLAMRAWRIRIEDMQGRPLTRGRACVRYILGWVWIAPPLALIAVAKPYAHSISSVLSVSAGAMLAWVLLWAAASLLHPQRQFWHDVVAGTRIVSA